MQIAVRCTDAQQEELVSCGIREGTDVIWVVEKEALLHQKHADAVIDLLFENEPENLALLRQASGLKIINSVMDTVPETEDSFIRINGWPTFLKAPVVEASCLHGDLKKLAETVFSVFDKTVAWLPDHPGFVVPRVVSLIVNEAYFALAEGVSTPEEIDIAMKLGTAYPFGPLEWSEKIGLKHIAALLLKLGKEQPRYTPAPLLLQQAHLI